MNYMDVVDNLRNCSDIVIGGHINPDGDCVGACMALASMLKMLGKEVRVLLDEFSSKFDFIQGKEMLYTGDYSELTPDAFIACDCASKQRLGEAAAIFDRAKITINIDHHVSNDEYAQINYVARKASSTCEFLFGMITSNIPINVEIGTALCAGILYDTGGLRHNNTSPETLLLMSRLLSIKVPLSDIYNKLFYEHTIEESKVFGRAMEHFIVLHDSPIAVSYLTATDLKELGATTKDLDGIVEYLLNTKDIEVSLFMYEKSQNNWKISLRSKSIHVSNVARVFDGGGHLNAAGANCLGELNDVIREVTSLIKEEMTNK